MFDKRIFTTLTATALLTFGLTASVQAAQVITIDPSALGSERAPFQTDFLNGNSSTLVELNFDSNTSIGAGWINLTSASLGGSSVGPGNTGLDIDYQIFATFEYTTSLVSGTLGQPGSDNVLTSLDFVFWGAPNRDSVFQSAAADGTPAIVTPGAGTEMIGFGNLLDGVANINNQGGTGFNSVTTYFNTAFGESFFVGPDPFPNVTFQEFNNTSQGVSTGENLLAINQTSGGVDFAVQQIAEPGSLALLGLGLLGMGLGLRRRSGER